MPLQDPDVDTLRSFYERRHPYYHINIGHWLFCEATYTGGRSWFVDNLFRYFKEGVKEFQDRLARAYRYNHTREAVDLVQKYLFKGEVARNEKDATQPVKDFWARATLLGDSVETLMRLAATAGSIGGRCAIVVDNNFKPNSTSRPLSIAEAKESKARIYAYVVRAKDILDYAYDEDGDGGLLWIKLREITRDDADPVGGSGLIYYRVKLWTRTGWELYEDLPETDRTVVIDGQTVARRKIKLVDHGDHTLGRVPVILVDHALSPEPYVAPGLIDDIVYLDRAVANYLSNLDAIIQDQTFSQLAIPAQALMPGDEALNKVTELGTKRVFVFDGGAGAAKPEYLSPDPKQVSVILSVVSKTIAEIYHSIGLAGERTKEDNSQGIDNSSGVAKAYDFERVNSLLVAKSIGCEKAENDVVTLVSLWAGEGVPDKSLVQYPKTFDVMRLADELVTSESLAKTMAPIELRREQMRAVMKKLFPRISEDLETKIMANIDTWLEGSDVLPPMPTAFGGPAAPGTKTNNKAIAAPSAQGSVKPKVTPGS